MIIGILVDGVWEPWTAWSACDVTCANGTRFRTRNCTGPFYGGAECPGPNIEIEDCFPRMCEGMSTLTPITIVENDISRSLDCCSVKFFEKI